MMVWRRIARLDVHHIVLTLVLLLASAQVSALAQHGPKDEPFTPIVLDALDGNRWSQSAIEVTPGQRIILTNRDVDRHTFVVQAWGVKLNLPTLQPVDLVVPESATIGSDVQFWSDVGDDRTLGMQGVILVISAEEAKLRETESANSGRSLENRRIVELNDDFTIKPETITISPGDLLEVRNIGVIEHHFVVDAWNVNETIGPGDISIVRVPENAVPGDMHPAYCSVPGHLEQGMTATIRVVKSPIVIETTSPGDRRAVRVSTDLRAFMPSENLLGAGWSQLRSGSSDSLLNGLQASPVFPDKGYGAVYLGPNGTRMTVVALPMADPHIPAKQAEESTRQVAGLLTRGWSIDRVKTAAFREKEPPRGCDVSSRTSGIVPVVTMPAGLTTCQIRGAGITIFVAIEGVFSDKDGVNAADLVVDSILTPGGRRAPVPATPGATPVGA